VAAPEHVPVDVTRPARTYESSPRLPDPWVADRPADLKLGQPRGPRLGNQGPDQGYVLVLAGHFDGKLTLTPGEHQRDVLAGAAAIALKRASSFGRAPVLHDLTIALTIWGYLGEAPSELVELRKPLFEEVAHSHSYTDSRRLVDMVPEEVLRRTPEQILDAHRRDWRSLITLDPAAV
jgi:hypothetical protein